MTYRARILIMDLFLVVGLVVLVLMKPIMNTLPKSQALLLCTMKQINTCAQPNQIEQLVLLVQVRQTPLFLCICIASTAARCPSMALAPAMVNSDHLVVCLRAAVELGGGGFCDTVIGHPQTRAPLTDTAIG